MFKLGTQQTIYILSPLLIFFLSISIYINTLNNGFLFDDYDTIVNNAMIREAKYLPNLFKKDYFSLSAEMSYRPIVTLTYFLDYAIYGLKPWGYHLTNLLLHAINGVLLYIFLFWSAKDCLRFQKREQALALQISLLFVSHPVLTEAVNAISFREDLLCFLFFISALIIYVRGKRQDTRSKNIEERGILHLTSCLLLLTSCFLYLLALLSKEMAVTLPLIVYGCEQLFQEKGRRFYSALLNPLLIGYAVVTLIYLYVRFFYLYNPNEGAIPAWSFFERLSTVPYLLLSHIKLSVYPVNLSADYYIAPVKSLFSLSFVLPLFVCISFLITALKLTKIEKHISFGIFFFFTALMPVYNIIPIAIPLAERYLYLPILGFTIVLGMVIHKAAHSDTSPYLRGGWVGLSLLIIICGLYSAGTIKRNYVWRDGYILWTDTVKKSPQGCLPHNNMGVEYFKKNDFDRAIKHFNRAIGLKPNFVEAYYNLGLALAMQGRIDEAIVNFSTAIRLKPDYSEAHHNLGVALESQGKIEKAFKHYNQAIKLKPNNAEALNNLSWLIVTQKRFSPEGVNRAVQLAEQACRLTGNRNAVCLNTLAAAYAASGQFQKAVNAAIEGVAQAIAAGQMQLANEIRNNLELYKIGRHLHPHPESPAIYSEDSPPHLSQPSSLTSCPSSL